MFVKILGWMPDADETTQGVLTDVQDMVPTLKGYAGVKTPIATALPALAAECRGAAVMIPLDDSTIVFAGTQTALYKAGASTWEDVSKSGGYTGSANSKWCFSQQGNVTFAVNKTDNSQYYLSGTSTDFANVAGMPKAQLVEAVGNFVLIGNYNDGTDTVDGWGCSAIGDYTNWTASTTTQCTYGRLYDTPGPLTGLKRLHDYAIYYKRKSVYLARYAGQPNAWEFSLVSDHIGSVSNEAIVRAGAVHYFLSEDNFYTYDSASIQPIGDSIKAWFNADCNNAYRYKTEGLHDESLGVIYWFYPQGTSTIKNAWVAYNYRSQRWGKGTLSVESVLQYVSSGLSYDMVDALYTTYAAFQEVTYDALNPSSKSKIPAIIDTAHRLKTLTGNTTSSSLTSGAFGDDSAVTLLSRVRGRYLVSPASAEMTNYYGDSPGGMSRDASITEISGRCDVLRSSRWHKIKLDFTGNVEISGADIITQSDGEE